jgi:hypothetical protein
MYAVIAAHAHERTEPRVRLLLLARPAGTGRSELPIRCHSVVSVAYWLAPARTDATTPTTRVTSLAMPMTRNAPPGTAGRALAPRCSTSSDYVQRPSTTPAGTPRAAPNQADGGRLELDGAHGRRPASVSSPPLSEPQAWLEHVDARVVHNHVEETSRIDLDVRSPAGSLKRETEVMSLVATLEWVHWFNDQRLHSALGDIPPAEFETAHYAAQPAAVS